MGARLLLGVFALIALAGCQATGEVAIELDESGRGQVSVAVELDDAAAHRIGDLGQLVAADDLEEAGWEISVAERRVLARKEVESERALDVALDELGAPFSDLSFERRESFARTSIDVSGRVDFSQGLAALGDADLQRLTGSATGVDISPESVALALTINLPGEETTNSATPQARWDLPLGAVVPVRAESTDVNVIGLSAVVVAVLCGLVLLGALVVRLRP